MELESVIKYLSENYKDSPFIRDYYVVPLVTFDTALQKQFSYIVKARNKNPIEWWMACLKYNLNVRLSHKNYSFKVQELSDKLRKKFEAKLNKTKQNETPDASVKKETPDTPVEKDTSDVLVNKKITIKKNRYKPDMDYYKTPEMMTTVQKIVNAHLNIFIYGPTGTGKSELLQKAIPDCQVINLNGETTIDDFVGYFELVNGNTILNEGILARCMLANVPLLIDELDAASPEILFVLQRVLEKKDLLLKNGRRVQPGDKFFIAATANTTGRGDDTTLYQGTNVLNEAFLDRFAAVFYMDYPDEDFELDILVNKTGLHRKVSKDIIAIANMARISFQADKLFSTFSIRKCLWLAKVLLLDIPFSEAFKLTVTNKVEDADKEILNEFFQRVMGYAVGDDPVDIILEEETVKEENTMNDSIKNSMVPPLQQFVKQLVYGYNKIKYND